MRWIRARLSDAMPRERNEGVSLQREYYARTAARYDELHDEEFEPGLEIVLDCLHRWEASSVLDVGTGTGRLVRELRARDPAMTLHGIDPVPECSSVRARTLACLRSLSASPLANVCRSPTVHGTRCASSACFTTCPTRGLSSMRCCGSQRASS